MDSIVNIIPKITSPLAVICFAFYIFYLYKTRQDKKEEKTLTIPDVQAQRDAARRILSKHPDIEIGQIPESASVELAHKIVSDNLRRYTKMINALLIFSLIFAATFLISLWVSKPGEPCPDDTNLSWAKIESMKKKYPYATLSVVQHIKLKLNNTVDSTKEMIAEFRNHYIISANRDIISSETIFEEQYTTSSGKIEYWQGTHKQKVKSNEPNNYWVHFDLKKNDVTSLLTGANFHYRFPLINSGNPTCFSNLTINPENEYFTCYPNSIDYIDNLIIIIESKDLELSLPPNSAFRKVKPEADEIISDGSCKVYVNNDQCTLSASWNRIIPGECVGFKLRWAVRH